MSHIGLKIAGASALSVASLVGGIHGGHGLTDTMRDRGRADKAASAVTLVAGTGLIAAGMGAETLAHKRLPASGQGFRFLPASIGSALLAGGLGMWVGAAASSGQDRAVHSHEN